ncbi:hypothetical protein O1A01_10790 [Sutcliffiella sp. NC1]|uniref:Uncharacterized protein n=2 Tax=Bacillaceae TaxID=186817 RepID=A0A223KP14_9BACI|nr:MULTISPECIES: hypothetical protein [Sutcliffiella]AST91255.1 hypothetical protein BC6307_08180 [Sutcliffiella cohnii]MED4018870.1 hypothetical protein [Sutcliffiella cohnii]WBL17550.1 hypothetical protein O1A01_10790 [Sutcliffiella sp. NC1]
MLAKLKKVKFDKSGKNPNYKALLLCPEGKQLYIRFDYTYATKTYWPLEVNYAGKAMDAKLAWYSRKVEKTTVHGFLEEIADKVNKKYGFEMKEH